LQVFVSVLPLKTFVEEVGGDRVKVAVMVQPGHSPATYDPSPKQIAALADADLFVRTGVPFEDAWMGRIRSANPRMPVLDVREGLALRPLEQHSHGSGEAAGPDLAARWASTGGSAPSRLRRPAPEPAAGLSHLGDADGAVGAQRLRCARALGRVETGRLHAGGSLSGMSGSARGRGR
jgi:ABC-type Zn uptake system ZnuABC Zn-binding protein ZnuA